MNKDDYLSYYQTGIDAFDHGDYKTAYENWMKSAKIGHAESQYNIGLCFLRGVGTAKNEEKAVEWFTKAASQGFAEAQYNLGLCYSSGQGASQNHELAFSWYNKAAQHNHAGALCNIGMCYSKGEGVPQDLEKAISYFTRSADLGYATAQFNLACNYAHGKGVEQDYKKTVYWLSKASEQGFVHAQSMLGFCYLQGLGVPQDDLKAINYLLQAAKQGDIKAKQGLETARNRFANAPNYYLQHRALRDEILQCNPNTLQIAIQTEDKYTANKLFCNAYDKEAQIVDQRFWHVSYDIRFVTIGNKKALCYRFLPYVERVPECEEIWILVNQGTIYYFTIKYGDGHPAVRFGRWNALQRSEEEIMEIDNFCYLCRWTKDEHINYGSFKGTTQYYIPWDSIKKKITEIIDHEAETKPPFTQRLQKESKKTNYSNMIGKIIHCKSPFSKWSEGIIRKVEENILYVEITQGEGVGHQVRIMLSFVLSQPKIYSF